MFGGISHRQYMYLHVHKIIRNADELTVPREYIDSCVEHLGEKCQTTVKEIALYNVHIGNFLSFVFVRLILIRLNVRP